MTRIVDHIQEWAEDLWKPHRELFQRALKAQSQLSFELIHWIASVSEMLIEIASAPVAGPRIAADLRKSASWLISTLSWVPQDKASVDLAERFGVTDELFRIAQTAQERGAPEIAANVQDLMLDRACTVMGLECVSLPETIQGLCVLAATNADANAVTALGNRLRKALANGSSPSSEHRLEAARQISVFGSEYTRIGYAMRQVDRQALVEAIKTCEAVLREPPSTNV